MMPFPLTSLVNTKQKPSARSLQCNNNSSFNKLDPLFVKIKYPTNKRGEFKWGSVNERASRFKVYIPSDTVRWIFYGRKGNHGNCGPNKYNY